MYNSTNSIPKTKYSAKLAIRYLRKFGLSTELTMYIDHRKTVFKSKTVLKVEQQLSANFENFKMYQNGDHV